jgi:hypothetical protein
MEISRRDFLKQSLVFPLVLASSKAFASNSAWPHLRQWDFEEFGKYSQWVENVFNFKKNGNSKQKVARIHNILKDDEMNLLNNPNFIQDGNLQVSDGELNLMNSLNHCGSFPKLMLVYYAMRRGLPANIAKINSGRGGDIRYSYGNHPVSQITSFPFSGDFGDFVNAGIGSSGGGYNFVTGNFRTAPFLEETDSVPIKISRIFLRSGSVGYNANGHGLLVGKIYDSGEVGFLDAHPDHSITFNQGLSALPLVKGFSESDSSRCYDGFRNFRLYKVVNGVSVPFTNEEMKDFGFSVSQYEDMAKINSGELVVNGNKIESFPEYVRVSLQHSDVSPLDFLILSAREFGEMFRERAIFVNESWQDVLRNGPIVFPNDSLSENIYQAQGRWEIWSSPSSDVDRKQKYNYVATRLDEMVKGFGKSPGVNYNDFLSQEEMALTMLNSKKTLFEKEKIPYISSSGGEFVLSLLDIEDRLFDLSFNPNHPPELRWGAPLESKEREGMKLMRIPLRTGGSLDCLRSYELERGLRLYAHRQTTPSYLDNSKNPQEVPFLTIEQRLSDYLNR